MFQATSDFDFSWDLGLEEAQWRYTHQLESIKWKPWSSTMGIALNDKFCQLRIFVLKVLPTEEKIPIKEDFLGDWSPKFDMKYQLKLKYLIMHLKESWSKYYLGEPSLLVLIILKIKINFWITQNPLCLQLMPR